MSFPLAISPSVKQPGLALLVNLISGAASPGTTALRACLMAPKSSSGTATVDTVVYESVPNADEVATLAGVGTPAALTAKAIFAEYPLAKLDFVAVTAGAGVAATGTITLDDTSPVTVAQELTVKICGRPVSITWAAAELDTDAAARLKLAIDAASRDLPVTAGVVGAVITLTARYPGPWGNDVTMEYTLTGGAGGAVTLSGAALASGATEPTFATALATIAGREYDFILPVVSNADAQSASSTSNPGRVKTHITTYQTGLSAKLQMAVLGATAGISAIKTGTGGRNFGPMQYVFCQNGRSLGCEFAGAELGRRMREESIDPAFNGIGQAYRAVLYGSTDLLADALLDSEQQDLLSTGVTPVGYDSSGAPIVIRPITTYHKDANSNADDRLLDTSRVSGLYAVAKDIRTALPQQFPNRKLSDDIGDGEELPDGVTTISEVKAFIITRLRFWQRRGVVRKDKLDAAIADASLVVRVNPSDNTQCDIVIPLAIVPPLAKFSVVVNQQT